MDEFLDNYHLLNEWLSKELGWAFCKRQDGQDGYSVYVRMGDVSDWTELSDWTQGGGITT